MGQQHLGILYLFGCFAPETARRPNSPNALFTPWPRRDAHAQVGGIAHKFLAWARRSNGPRRSIFAQPRRLCHPDQSQTRGPSTRENTLARDDEVEAGS